MRHHLTIRRPAALWFLCLLLALGLSAQLAAVPAAAEGAAGSAPFSYQHDPRLNPKAMEDIVWDPSAPYGFSPSPAGSLKEYVENFDWQDPAAVALGRQERIAYHESLRSMYDMLLEMKAQGKSTEEIARTMSAERNALRIASYEGDPEGLATMKARNLEKYGREEGPTPDEMYEKYGSWEMVLEKAFSGNVGMDACLGLYDDYYPVYLALGQVPEENAVEATREYAVSAFVRAIGRNNFPGGEGALSAFSDERTVTPWYQTELAGAAASGIIKGYEDGTLRPGETIRRVEAFVILSRCLPELEAVRDPIPFRDVPSWAGEDLSRLSAAGLVEGYGNNTLGAQDLLTVEQVGLLAARLSDLRAA